MIVSLRQSTFYVNLNSDNDVFRCVFHFQSEFILAIGENSANIYTKEFFLLLHFFYTDRLLLLSVCLFAFCHSWSTKANNRKNEGKKKSRDDEFANMHHITPKHAHTKISFFALSLCISLTLLFCDAGIAWT